MDFASGIISTLTGMRDFYGYSGDGGLAMNATLSAAMFRMTLNSQANIYIADSINKRIRFVNASTGIITTFAGTGSSSSQFPVPDNMPALSTDMDVIVAVFVDSSSGTVFFSEGSRIRRITGGRVYTIAGDGFFAFRGDGGLARDSRVDAPQGICVDSTGNIFIADSGNNRIRKISIFDDIIDTYAGDGTATFGEDSGPAVGAALNFPAGICIH